MSQIKVKAHLNFERISQAIGMKFERTNNAALPEAVETYSGTALYATHANFGNGTLFICQKDGVVWKWIAFGDVTSFETYLTASMPLKKTKSGDVVNLELLSHADHFDLTPADGNLDQSLRIKAKAVNSTQLAGTETGVQDTINLDAQRAVGTPHIKDEAVTTRAIKDAAVTLPKIAPQVMDKVYGVSKKGTSGNHPTELITVVDTIVPPAVPATFQTIPYADAVHAFVVDQVSGATPNVLEGDGIEITTAGSNKTIKARPDNLTIGFIPQDGAPSAPKELQVKDNSISTGKIVDGAVIETKIGTDAVTTAKIKDGNVGFAKITQADIVKSTDNSNAGLNHNDADSDTMFATAKAIRAYVSDVVGALGEFRGGWHFQANANSLPSDGSEGDYWYVTNDYSLVIGEVTTDFIAGDLIIAKGGTFGTEPNNIHSNPSTLSDWVFIKTKRGPAKETSYGLTKYASQAQVDAFTAGDFAVRPQVLKRKYATVSLGVKEKSHFGTDIVRRHVEEVTGASATHTVTHGLETRYVHVSLYDFDTNEEVWAKITRNTTNSVVIDFSSNLGTQKIVVVVSI